MSEELNRLQTENDELTKKLNEAKDLLIDVNYWCFDNAKSSIKELRVVINKIKEWLKTF